MNRSFLSLLAVAALAAWTLVSCGDDLLSTTCGGATCGLNQSCVANVCVDNEPAGCTDCTENQHCVSGVCVDNYTASNVCDPLRQCRNGCGLSAACAAECEADRSDECAVCTEEIVACTSREGCDTAGSANGCCEAEFCACFPSAPGCGNVADCRDCQVECDGDTACFNTCRVNALACNLCLQPFDECAAENGQAECVPEFCACLDADLEAGCQ